MNPRHIKTMLSEAETVCENSSVQLVEDLLAFTALDKHSTRTGMYATYFAGIAWGMIRMATFAPSMQLSMVGGDVSWSHNNGKSVASGIGLNSLDQYLRDQEAHDDV